MTETLTGTTYPGTALVADLRVACGLPLDGSALVAAAEGYVLLAPLPGGRWLSFVGDLDEAEAERLHGDRSIAAVTAAIERRIPNGAVRVDEVAWASPFRMHRRLAPHLADKRRFLLGDAGHLSSPFGGEGLNSGLQDAHNLAWKIALEQRGRARPSLLGSFDPERAAADRHVLEISDSMHRLAEGAVESARTGVFPAPPSRERLAAMVRSVAGTGHHLLISGAADDFDVVRLSRKWHDLVEITRAMGNGGQAASEAVLLRPDGYIGFRAVPASPAGLRALDAHLDSYLMAA